MITGCLDSSGQLFFNLDSCFADKYAEDLFQIECFFYRKGKPFYITAKGFAVRVLKKVLHNQPAEKLIRAKILSIEFNELRHAKKKHSFSSYFSLLSFH